MRRQLAERRARGAGRGGGRGPRAGRRRGVRGRGPGSGGRGHRHGLLRVEGRDRHGQPDRRGRRGGRGPPAGQLRGARRTCASTACRSGGCSAAARPAGTRPGGSCIVVVATDAPLSSAQLTRLARRAGLGLARTGSVAHHGSGEIFLAFSLPSSRAARGEPGPPGVPDGDLDPLFSAAVDATEEAVLGALWNAERVEGRDGPRGRGAAARRGARAARPARPARALSGAVRLRH